MPPGKKGRAAQIIRHGFPEGAEIEAVGVFREIAQRVPLQRQEPILRDKKAEQQHKLLRFFIEKAAGGDRVLFPHRHS